MARVERTFHRNSVVASRVAWQWTLCCVVLGMVGSPSLAADKSAEKTTAKAGNTWVIDSADEWKAAADASSNLKFDAGTAEPSADTASYASVVKTFKQKRKATSIVFKPSPVWHNWEAIPSVGPKGTRNAPVFLPIGKGNYWYFAASSTKGQRGYHGWHSKDMKTWTHQGQVTKSNWMTTAEYADGKFYLYYDQPNDEDPHLVIATDIKAGKLKEVGKVFADPSHGSDAGIIRDEDGFHLIYEDWDPINARKNSWDSPLAGHADSPDGIKGFKPHEHTPPIDERTKATGKFSTYRHPDGTYKYEIHEPAQNAYGDYTVIRVGGQYYIFCDFDPHDGPMRVGCWTSDALNKKFTWSGDIGMGFHPDPTVGFAEGKFYLIVQRAKQDFISPGPWVPTVTARAGVDTDGDGKIDKWTDWQEVKESYDHKPGYARLVDTTAASLDLSKLPAGTGFKFEFKMNDSTKNKSKPMLDRVTMSFE